MKYITLFALLTCAAAQDLHPVIILCRATKVVQANQAAKMLDIAYGEKTFTVPLTTTGTDTAAYWCNWQMTREDAINIRNYIQTKTSLTFTNPATGKWLLKQSTTPVLAVYDAEVWTTDAVLADWGLSVLNKALP